MSTRFPQYSDEIIKKLNEAYKKGNKTTTINNHVYCCQPEVGYYEPIEIISPKKKSK